MNRPELTAVQRAEINSGIADADPSVRMRAKAVELWYDHRKVRYIADRYRRSTGTIRGWVSAFNERGLDGLRPAKRTTTGLESKASTASFYEYVGDSIQRARLKRNWSRNQLLIEAGLGYGVDSLAHWEDGSWTIPLVAFAKFCDALRISASDILIDACSHLESTEHPDREGSS